MKTVVLLYSLVFSGLTVFFIQQKSLEQSLEDGAEIYQDFCVQCHLDQGQGVANAFPPLAKSDFLKKQLELSLKGVKYGMRGPIEVNGKNYDGVMVAQGLDDQEVADVMNYVLSNWGNQLERPITAAQVADIQK
ncbi:MAG: c-type cytochrome [Flavobacteriaceae bacterium]